VKHEIAQKEMSMEDDARLMATRKV
jgi:hypothetical protein